MTGRLLISARGESVKVLDFGAKDGIVLQSSALADRVTELAPFTISEISLNKQDATALILQLADAIGMACELRTVKKPLDPYK